MHCRSQLMQHRRRSFQEIRSGKAVWAVGDCEDSSGFRFSCHSTTLTYDRYWSAKSLSLALERARPSGFHAAVDCQEGATGKFDGRAGVERKISADGQLGDAMDQRP